MTRSLVPIVILCSMLIGTFNCVCELYCAPLPAPQLEEDDPGHSPYC